jgi:hypothetical protein
MYNKKNSNDQEEQDNTTLFAGFVPPTRNYFMMPNEWTDITAEIDSLAELKVVEYVLRHTWGFHEFGICKAISVDEFMYGRKRSDGSRMDKGTGLKSDRSVKDGIKLAIKHGYLVCHVDDSDQARIRKSYALKMRDDNNLPTRGVVSTSPVNTTPGRNYPSDLQILPLGPANSTPRSEKETLERHLPKERETPPSKTPSSPVTQTDSLSQEKSSLSLLAQLTDSQADFWTRWCAIAGSTQELNETAHKHVVVLAEKITTTQALQSLYNAAYDRLKELAGTTTGKEPVPPRLGNLVKCLPEWEQAQTRKQQEKEQKQSDHAHVTGTGQVTNWTQARISGNLPPINYDPLPPAAPRRARSATGNGGGWSQAGSVAGSALSAGLQERIRQAREKRQTAAD